MREPIEVNYVPDGDDWQVTVTGLGEKREATATSLITAREQAEELVAELVPEEERRSVVHLLNGDALAFTSAYLSARLGRPDELPVPAEPDSGKADRAPTNQG
jgi:hypothetical protein